MRTIWGGPPAAACTLLLWAGSACAARTVVPNRCAEERLLYEVAAFAIGKDSTPPSSKVVRPGTAVRLAAESQWPLTFHVAGRPNLLGRRDLLRRRGDSRKGQHATRYLLRLPRRLTAKPGRLYWDVSFTAKVVACRRHRQTFFSTAMHGKPHLLIIAARQRKR